MCFTKLGAVCSRLCILQQVLALVIFAAHGRLHHLVLSLRHRLGIRLDAGVALGVIWRAGALIRQRNVCVGLQVVIAPVRGRLPAETRT